MKIMVLENINGNISENDIDNVNNGRNNNGIITSSNLNDDESNRRRYPKRNRKPPVHLNDYGMNNEEDVVNFVDFSKCSGQNLTNPHCCWSETAWKPDLRQFVAVPSLMYYVYICVCICRLY